MNWSSFKEAPYRNLDISQQPKKCNNIPSQKIDFLGHTLDAKKSFRQSRPFRRGSRLGGDIRPIFNSLCWVCYYLALSHYLSSFSVCQLRYSNGVTTWLVGASIGIRAGHPGGLLPFCQGGWELCSVIFYLFLISLSAAGRVRNWSKLVNRVVPSLTQWITGGVLHKMGRADFLSVLFILWRKI